MEPGFGELLLLALVGVLFLGPRELARIAYKLGAFVRQVRRMSQEFMYELTREADLEDAREEVKKIEAMMKSPDTPVEEGLVNYHPAEAGAPADPASTLAADKQD